MTPDKPEDEYWLNMRRLLYARIDTLRAVATILSFEGMPLTTEQLACLKRWEEQLRAQLPLALRYKI